MERSNGSVRIGPISLFVLIIVLCLAVLAVLSLQTARAQQAVTEQQATVIEDTYVNEVAGQEFLSQLDAILVQGRSGAISQEETFRQINAFISAQTLQDDLDTKPVIDASFNEQDVLIKVVFTLDSGRKLNVTIQINPDLTYDVLSWSVLTEWIEPGTNIILWQG